MVRIKERYLLVNLLYPDALKDSKPGEPDLAVLHRPTTNDLTPQAILRAVRAQVNSLFGDYGAGLIERGLQRGFPFNIGLYHLPGIIIRDALSTTRIANSFAASLATNPPETVKYLSNATSTFILRVHREHYRLVWAALTFMDRVPIKNGLPCTFRVVHASGTMRRVEIAAIRRHKALLLAVEKQMTGSESDVLETLFGGKSAEDQMRGVLLGAQGDDEPGPAGLDEDD